MKDILHFEPLITAKYKTYIEVGTLAYNQHYLHLWPQENTSPYIESSFTNEVLLKEETDDNTLLYLIQLNGKAVGIFKITLNSGLDTFTKEEALCIDKIYILNEFSGIGIGKKVLQFVELRAKELGKKLVWLDTMQKGHALHFYQKNGYTIHGESKVHFAAVLPEEKFMWVMVKRVDG